MADDNLLAHAQATHGILNSILQMLGHIGDSVPAAGGIRMLLGQAQGILQRAEAHLHPAEPYAPEPAPPEPPPPPPEPEENA